MENENDDFHFGAQKELFYSFEGRKFTTRSDYHSDSDKIFMRQNWELYKERARDARNKVLAGKSSPILYHMEKRGMELNVLAASTGIAKWKVRLHCKPWFFKKLNNKILQKYASVFEIEISGLDNIDEN
jgi:hypothetical protein